MKRVPTLIGSVKRVQVCFVCVSLHSSRERLQVDESNIVNELMKRDAEQICFDVRGHSFLQIVTAICQPLL